MNFNLYGKILKNRALQRYFTGLLRLLDGLSDIVGRVF